MTNKIKEVIKRYRVCHVLIPISIGVLFSYFLKLVFGLNLTVVFGNSQSYVYHYAFSTIVQGFIALVAFLGMLAVFKLQRDQSKRDRFERPIGDPEAKELDSAMRLMTIDLMTFAMVCLIDVALALIGILLIPYFTNHALGPAYLLSNIVLSIYVLLFLTRPIIQKVLNLTP